MNPLDSEQVIVIDLRPAQVIAGYQFGNLVVIHVINYLSKVDDRLSGQYDCFFHWAIPVLAAIAAESCTENLNSYSCYDQLSDIGSVRLYFARMGLVLDSTVHHREQARGLYGVLYLRDSIDGNRSVW